jgi:hypothetical protein
MPQPRGIYTLADVSAQVIVVTDYQGPEERGEIWGQPGIQEGTGVGEDGGEGSPHPGRRCGPAQGDELGVRTHHALEPDPLVGEVTAIVEAAGIVEIPYRPENHSPDEPLSNQPLLLAREHGEHDTARDWLHAVGETALLEADEDHGLVRVLLGTSTDLADEKDLLSLRRSRKARWRSFGIGRAAHGEDPERDEEKVGENAEGPTPARAPRQPDKEQDGGTEEVEGMQVQVAAESDPDAETHEQVKYRSVDGCHVRLG